MSSRVPRAAAGSGSLRQLTLGAILESLGLPSRAPPIAAAGLDPEADGIEHVDFDPSYVSSV